MEQEALLKSLAETLSSKKLTADQMSKLATGISGCKHPVVGVDVCTHGICLDFDVNTPFNEIDINDLTGVLIGPITNIEIFPEGIILPPDRTRVRLTQKL